ncbi:MAG: DUF4127 family protein [Anaerolineae bacterium]|nr:DUF4127 family protein [Anaerolineae bacterium]
MRIGLIPLDERPVNTRYPAMIAAIAGVELVQPPPSALSAIRQPASTSALQTWLRDVAPTLDRLIVSIETLGHGGLIASRTADTPALAVAQTLEVLHEIKASNPALSIYGFNVIQRISYSNNNFEEPLYWSDYGSLIYEYSQYFDQQGQGQEVSGELEVRRAQIPPDILRDFISHRLRNHIINLLVLQMAVEDVFDLLVISSDDTSEYGFGSREKAWLTEWVNRLDLERLLLYPGADEVGSALLARAINTHFQQQPKFYAHYAIPGDEELVAPFEDGPLRLTLERQVRAVGGVLVSAAEDADLIIAVNTPSRQFPQKSPPHGDAVAAEYQHRLPVLAIFVKQIQQWVEAGRQVIVTDVAYPNGADPVLVDQLCEHVDLTQLAAYGAWNTAGNTIGVALAQGVAALHAENDAQREAKQRFLLHHFLEDWGYQYHVRTAAQQQFGEVTAENRADVKAFIETGLRERLSQLPAFAEKWQVSHIRLPWERFFEVDFDLDEL